MSRSATFLCAIVALTAIETASVRAEILIATAGPFTGQNTFKVEQPQQDAEMAVDNLDGSTSGESLASETRKQLRKRDTTEALYEAYVPARRSDFGRKTTEHKNLKGEIVNLAAWDRAYEEKCYFFRAEYKKSKKMETFERLLRIIKNEPQISNYLLGKSASEKVAICEDDNQLESSGYYDYDYHIIGLLRAASLSKQTLILVHELRHLDQISRGYYHSLDYDIDEMVRLTFAVEADANAIMTLFAWRMKQLGFVGPWITLKNTEKYSDIPNRFEAEMKNGSNEIAATRAAFIQWYQSDWRATSYYRTARTGYLDLLDETKRLRRYYKLPADYLDGLCLLPAGENYGCHLTKEIFAFPPIN
jgi:hypothetical protein